MNLGCWTFGTILALAALRVHAGEFDSSSYRPSTLAESHADMCAPHPEIEPVERTIDGRLLKVRAVVTNQGEARTIETGVLDLIQFWQKSFLLPPEVASLYSKEVRIRESAHDYWLPIQTPLLESLLSEVRGNRSFTIYAVFAGCAKDRPIFLITGFETSEKEEEGQPPNQAPPADG
jgi:hypothetical protein